MAREIDKAIERNLIESGLPSVLSQTFRMMIYSRMRTGFRNYEYTYPDTDFLVFEPKPSDYRMFYTNIFSFENRKDVCEYAYQTTRRDLLERADKIEPVLKKYDIHLNRAVLMDQNKKLYSDIYKHPGGSRAQHSIDRANDVLNTLDRILDELELERGEAA
jgi:hypothetical protein